MAQKGIPDARLSAARYRVDGALPEKDDPELEENIAGQPRMEARASYVEQTIQQAIRRGEFDNLPGAGKPLPNLHGIHDPDWWIRQKIERENLTGLGPPALTLRIESDGLDDRIDCELTEARVREVLVDFNRRVIEARRQLTGGPPVVTATRDVERELELWRERQDVRRAADAEARRQQAETRAAMSWRERRRNGRNP
jgi:hypothetical protein